MLFWRTNLGMDIVIEKNQIIEEIDALNDKHLIRAIKELLKYARQSNTKHAQQPFTKKELLNRAKMEEKDIKNGKVTTLAALRKEVKTDDETILRQVKKLLAEEQAESWNDLDTSLKASLKRAIVQSDNNEVTPHNKVMAKLKRKYTRA